MSQQRERNLVKNGRQHHETKAPSQEQVVAGRFPKHWNRLQDDKHDTASLTQPSALNSQFRIANGKQKSGKFPQNIHKGGKGQSPTASVIIGACTITALIDSGADKHLMRSSIAGALDLTPRGNDEIFDLACDRHEMRSVACVTAKVNVYGIEYTLEFILIDNLGVDLILGVSFMSLHKRVTFVFHSKDNPLTICLQDHAIMFCSRCGILQAILVRNSDSTDPISHCSCCYSSAHLRIPGEHLSSIFQKQGLQKFHNLVAVDIKDRKFTAVVDSGSNCSLMKLSVANMLNLSIFGPTSTINLAAEHSFETVHGMVATAITLNSREYTLVFGVVKELRDDLLLGVDFMRLHREVHFEFGGEKSPLTVPCNTQSSITDPVRVFRLLRQYIPPRFRFLTMLLSPFAALLTDGADNAEQDKLMKLAASYISKSPAGDDA